MSILSKARKRARAPIPGTLKITPSSQRKRKEEDLKDLGLIELHEGQRNVLQTARRFNVCSLGRRFGKSELAKYLICETAYIEKGRVAYCSPTNKALNEFWSEIKAILAEKTLSKSETNLRLQLTNGGIIELWSMEHPERPRGRKYHRVIFDEAAQVAKLGLAWQQVMRPTLMDFKGDCWWFSTPKGRNYFWQLFRKGDPDNPFREEDWQSWQISSYGNPHIDPTEIDALVADLPERDVQQEIYAAFNEDDAAVFRRVREAACAEWQERAVEDHTYYMGVDLARTNDWTVISVVDSATQELVYLDRFRELDYNLQRTRIAGVFERFNAAHIIIEANAMGWPNIDELRMQGYPVIPFTTTAQTKKHIIDKLVQAFELGQIRIIPEEALVEELLSFEATRLPSGLIRYAAPEGQHDDMVMSLAFAWAGLATYGDGDGGIAFS